MNETAFVEKREPDWQRLDVAHLAQHVEAFVQTAKPCQAAAKVAHRAAAIDQNQQHPQATGQRATDLRGLNPTHLGLNKNILIADNQAVAIGSHAQDLGTETGPWNQIAVRSAIHCLPPTVRHVKHGTDGSAGHW